MGPGSFKREDELAVHGSLWVCWKARLFFKVERLRWKTGLAGPCLLMKESGPGLQRTMAFYMVMNVMRVKPGCECSAIVTKKLFFLCLLLERMNIELVQRGWRINAVMLICEAACSSSSSMSHWSNAGKACMVSIWHWKLPCLAIQSAMLGQFARRSGFGCI